MTWASGHALCLSMGLRDSSWGWNWPSTEPCFFGGNGPIHWRTTCAQAYAEAIFCGRVLTRAFAGSLLSRNAFANALVFNFLKRELPHLHGHIFRFIGTSSSSWAHLPLHGHIMATYSTSLAHLPLHWHIFLFIRTSSPSSAHLPLHGYIFLLRTRGGGALAGHGLLPRELSRGFRRDTRGTLSEKCPIRFMPHLHTLSLRGETSKTDPRFAYADCLREDYREASARCLRVPTRTCKYQCFRFRGVNMSSPHKKVPSFQKKRGSTPRTWGYVEVRFLPWVCHCIVSTDGAASMSGTATALFQPLPKKNKPRTCGNLSGTTLALLAGWFLMWC